MAQVLNGDNGGVSEGTFFHHVRILEDLERQANSIKGKQSAAKKLAVDDGLNLKDLKKIMSERALTVDAQVESLNRQNAYRRFFKMPTSKAMPFIADIKDELGLTDEERQQKWEDEGYVAGKLGQNRDVCPHEDPNSLGARFWMAGYDKGQAELAKGIRQKPADKPKDKPAAETPPASTTATAKPGPQHEPEVAAAKARGGRKPKADTPPVDPVSKTGTVGVTYWHDVKGGRAIENKDGTPPDKGWENITRPEYDKLFAAYKAKADEEWESPAKPGTMATPPEAETVGDDDDDSGTDDDEIPPGPKH